MKKALIIMSSLLLSFLLFGCDLTTRYVEPRLEFGGSQTDETGYALIDIWGRWTEIVIPAEQQGFPVVEIAARFWECGAESVIIPATIQTIREGAFSECTSLKSFEVDDENPYFTDIDGVLYSKDLTRLIAYPGNRPGDFFSIPVSVSVIGPYAFSLAKNISHFEFPSTLSEIGSNAFRGCPKLASITIPDEVVVLGEGAFDYCSNLSTIVFPSDPYFTNIPRLCFESTGISSITIPSEIVTIEEGAFSSCQKLISVTFEEGSQMNLIGVMAFGGCQKLPSFSLPASVTTIEEAAFSSLIALEHFDIPSGSHLTSIGDRAFSWASQLETIVIPEGVETIGYRAFSYCGKLTIYSESSSAPSQWDNSWNPDGRPVVWGWNR
jgi:hypothetical protein